MLVTRADLRNLLLARQGLLGEREAGGSGGATAWVSAQGFLMLETIGRALAPAHDLVLFSRLAGYQAGDLDAALYGTDQLIEHHLHVLGALPAADYALVFDPERAARASRPGSIGALVLACLQEEGPCSLRDLQAHLRHGRRDGLRAVGQGVRALYDSGAILVRQREAGQAVYDLASRVLSGQPPQPLPLEERLRALARRALHILAPVTRATWSQVLGGIGARAGLGLSAMKREKSRLMAEMVAAGEVAQVEVTGPPELYLLPKEWLEGLARPLAPVAPRVSFLPPLDPVVWDGQRARDLFDFDIRQQAYRPTIAERRFAPPALPVLYGQDLVGRLEAQMNWAEGRLDVHAIHMEMPSLQEDGQFRAAFALALQDLAVWHGGRMVRATGPLPPRLLP